jgi:uncharacterized delta-60 repeat protein
VTPRRVVLAFPLAALIVAAFALPAFATPGDLDPTFSGDGKVRVGISGGVADVAIQPDGKVVAVGTGGGAFAILRLNRDGTPDHSFSGDGVAHISTGPGRTDFANAVAIRNGRIVVVGTSVRDDGVNALAILRLNADGSLDHTFSGDGIQLLRVGSRSTGEDVAIQSDGKIVVVGTSDQEFLVMRRLSNGDPDHTFSGDGSDRTAFSEDAEGRSVGIDPTNGRIVIGGILINGSGFTHDFAVAAYTKSGSLDPTFDGDGKMVRSTELAGGLSALSVLGTGRIVAVGVTNPGPQKGQMLVEKYTRSGAFDTSFGGGDGIVPIGFTTNGNARNDLASDVAVQQDGKIVVAGGSNGQTDEFALARLNPGGTLDASFHGGGVLTPFNQDAAGTGVAVNNGTHKIVVVGVEFSSGQSHAVDAMLAARYQGS